MDQRIARRHRVLQWGRDLEVAESAEVSVCGSLTSTLQWGRDLEVAESILVFRVERVGIVASMGPRLGSRGKPPTEESPAPSISASMGPRLGSRGKLIREVNEMKRNRLQWGRDLEVAERVYARNGSRRTKSLQWGRDLEVAESFRRKRLLPWTGCFNGAATWKSRKGGWKH